MPVPCPGAETTEPVPKTGERRKERKRKRSPLPCEAGRPGSSEKQQQGLAVVGTAGLESRKTCSKNKQIACSGADYNFKSWLN